MMDAEVFEGDVWREVFEAAAEVYRKLLRRPEEWEKVKLTLAEVVANVIVKYFKTVRRVAFADLSGGECASDTRPSLDVDILVLVDSPAEEYALRKLERVIDNALKEAFVYTTGYQLYKEIAKLYKRGLHHNLLELHVNDEFARMNSRFCPPIELYNKE